MMDDRIKRTLFHIEQHISEPVNLAELAEIACLSQHHFHRLFKTELGETPKAYVDRVRMEHIAHMMVIRKDLGLTALAFEYGFSSPAAFTRAFKALYRVSPRAFRDKQRAEHRARLEKHWAAQANQQSIAPTKVIVTHMPPKHVQAERTVMQHTAVNEAYKKLITSNRGRVSHGLTIYTENPFGSGRAGRRLHVALDEKPAPGTRDNMLELRGGYYQQQTVTGDFDAMTEAMFDNFQNTIEPSVYKVATTIFYERIKLPAIPEGFDYFTYERTVFGCLSKRP